MELKRFDPCGAAFLRMGRYDTASPACALWWSDSGIRTRLACTRLEIETEVAPGDHAPWLAVAMDGAFVARFPLAEGVRSYVVLAGLDASFEHEVSITRDTQPSGGDAAPVILRAVCTDGAPVGPVERPKLIEFIGDSLTVGEGSVGPVSAEEWRMVWISNAMAFPTLAAERLNAEKRVTALGGWGVWRAWDGEASHRIGLIYERLCAVIEGGDVPYRFDQRRADAVVINLGTNDGSALNLLPEAERPAALEEIQRRAVELMALVRAHEPEAEIVWAYGFCGNALEAPLKAAVEVRRAAGDGSVRYLPLSDFAGDFGARQHPGQAAHARAAAEIAALLADLWK